jgi:archaeal cell division control protein 6
MVMKLVKFEQTSEMYLSEFEELCPTYNPIFKNRDILTDSYEPPILVGRDAQKKEIMGNLQPITEYSSPINTFIHGKNGVGKSLTVAYVLKVFEVGIRAKFEDVIVKYVCVNCGFHTTDSDVVKNLLFQFDIDFNPRGYSIATSMEKIWDYIDEMGRKHVHYNVIFFFDEIDKLNQYKTKRGKTAQLDILYQITRAIEQKRIKQPNCKIGVILASNKKEFFGKIDQSVITSGKFYRYEFPNYKEEDLFQIMMGRMNAFNPNVITEDLIRYVAKDVADRYRGDARRALDTLLVAGKFALENQETFISLAHIQEADKRINQLKMEKAILEFSLHERYLLIAIDLCEKYVSAPRTGLVHLAYKWVCKVAGKSSVSYGETSRTITEWTEDKDIINVTKGTIRGNTRIITLSTDIKEAVQVLYTPELKSKIYDNILDLELIIKSK